MTSRLTLLKGSRFSPRVLCCPAAAGRYQLRLPYATDAAVSREVGAVGVYRVESAGRSAELEVREEDVRAGARLPGPGLEEERT